MKKFNILLYLSLLSTSLHASQLVLSRQNGPIRQNSANNNTTSNNTHLRSSVLVLPPIENDLRILDDEKNEINSSVKEVIDDTLQPWVDKFYAYLYHALNSNDADKLCFVFSDMVMDAKAMNKVKRKAISLQEEKKEVTSKAVSKSTTKKWTEKFIETFFQMNWYKKMKDYTIEKINFLSSEPYICYFLSKKIPSPKSHDNTNLSLVKTTPTDIRKIHLICMPNAPMIDNNTALNNSLMESSTKRKTRMNKYLHSYWKRILTKGDVKKFMALLSHTNLNINSHTCPKYKWKAIHYAAHYNHVDLLKFLLANGVRLTARDSQGNSGLHFAAQTGNKDTGKLLINAMLKKGISLNLRNNDGNTALHFSSNWRSGDFIQILGEGIDKQNGSFHIENNRGRTPLVMAILRGSVPAGKLLVFATEHSKTHRLDWKDMNGNSFLHYALMRHGRDHDDMAITLIRAFVTQNISLETRNHDKETALHFAAKYNKTLKDKSYKKCSHYCGEVNNNDEKKNDDDSSDDDSSDEGWWNKKFDVMKYLIDMNAKVNARNCFKETPLMVAIKSNSIDAVNTLLCHEHFYIDIGTNWDNAKAVSLHVDIFAKSIFKENALHYAIICNVPSFAKMVINKNYRLNHPNADQEYPIHYAAESDQGNIIDDLIEKYGIDNIHHRDASGQRPIDIALKLDNVKAFGALFSYERGHNKVSNSYFCNIVKGNKLKIAALLLDFGCYDFKKSNSFGKKALKIAAKNNYIEMTKLLLKFGAKNNFPKTKHISTPLQIADQQDNMKIVCSFM